MTEAQRIADGLVEAGVVLRKDGAYWLHGWRSPFGYEGEEEKIIADWRVAGKCLEAMVLADQIVIFDGAVILPIGHTSNGETISTGTVFGDSIPAAICKAFVEAKDG